jgi:hypothetical protein
MHIHQHADTTCRLATMCLITTDVKLLGINEKGQLRLSRKAVMVDDRAASALANEPAKV